MTPPRLAFWWPALLLLAASGPAVRADLFVSSLNTGEVLEYSGATGAFVKSFASGNGLGGPEGLVFGPNGDLFVSSTGGTAANSVLEYNCTTGAFVKNFVTAGSGGLSGPSFLVFNPVPEPSSLVSLVSGGLLGALAARRRSKRYRPSQRPDGSPAGDEGERAIGAAPSRTRKP
jgi:hypothetical protein